ncbi:MAG TPA: hypothetical protein VKP65_24035 [Rhodothermales bacterium]|nr:hypothetical protein [Rhodothermales bacterium]
MNDNLLRIYLNDHLGGSVGAIEVLEYCIEKNPDGALGALLCHLLKEIQADQKVLKDLLNRIEGTENPVKKGVAWVSEKIHRAKPSGEIFGYSDLTRLEELEELTVGITGKQSLWQSLHIVGEADVRFHDVDFQALARRAQQQRDELEPHRLDAARYAFVSRAEEIEGIP